MTPVQFSALVQLTDKEEADKAKLVAFYLHKVKNQPSFKLPALVDEMVSFGLSKPNTSRLKTNLAKSRSFIKASPDTVKLSLKVI